MKLNSRWIAMTLSLLCATQAFAFNVKHLFKMPGAANTALVKTGMSTTKKFLTGIGVGAAALGLGYLLYQRYFKTRHPLIMPVNNQPANNASAAPQEAKTNKPTNPEPQQIAPIIYDMLTTLPREITNLIAEYAYEFNGTNVASLPINANDDHCIRITSLPKGQVVIGSNRGNNRGIITITSPCIAPQQKWTFRQRIAAHKNLITSIVAYSDTMFISASWDHTIKVWTSHNNSDNQRIWQCTQTLSGHQNTVWELTILPNGTLISCSEDRTIKIWTPFINLQGKIEFQCAQTLDGHKFSVDNVIALSDTTIVAFPLDGSIYIWTYNNDTTTWQCTQTILDNDVRNNIRYSLTALPNDKFATGHQDGTINIWARSSNQKPTWKRLRELLYSPKPISALTALPNGTLAAANHYGRIVIWNPDTGEELQKLNADNKCITSLAVLPGGLLAACCTDGIVRIWETTTWSLVHTLRARFRDDNSENIKLAQFPDGTIVTAPAKDMYRAHEDTEESFKLWR